MRALSKKNVGVLFAALFMLLFVISCGPGNQENIDPAAQEAFDNPPAERQQALDVETWKDNRGGAPVFMYVVNLQGELLLSVTCRGVPGSSTESVEPNEGYAYGYSQYNNYGFRTLDDTGRRIYSPEQMGKDGTYGDPVSFRFCMTPEGAYVDVPPSMAIVSSVPLSFPQAGVSIDAALQARTLEAERAIKEGKCLNDDLSIRECDQRDVEVVEPTPVPEPTK
jgi:hypothetical protein